MRHPDVEGPAKFLAGFWVVDVKSPERAVEIAARISTTPGPGGAPVNQPVELHPIMEAPEAARNGWRQAAARSPAPPDPKLIIT